MDAKEGTYIVTFKSPERSNWLRFTITGKHDKVLAAIDEKARDNGWKVLEIVNKAHAWWLQ